MKKALIIVLCIIGVLVVVALALPFLVNANQFRPMIETQLQSALHRSVEIGDLSVSLMAGGIRAQNVSISEDPAYGKQPFLKAEALEVGVDFFSLIFSHSMHVNSVTLREPELRLIRGQGSRWNFSSIGAAEAPTAPARGKAAAHAAQPAAAPASTPAISIGTLKIVDGRVVMANASNLSRTHVYDHLQVKAENIGFDEVIPFSVSLNTPGGGELKADGKAGPIDRTDSAATPLDATVDVKHLDVASSGFVDPSSGMAGIIDYHGTLKSDGKNAQTAGEAHASSLRLVKTGSPARQAVGFNYSTNFDLKREAGVLNRGDVVFGKSAAHITGNYQAQAEQTVVHMKFNGNNLPVEDVEGLLPAFGVVLPPGSSLQGGTATANLSLDGPLDHLVITGPVNVTNTRLANFNLGSKMSALAALAGVRTGNDTDIQTLSSTLRVAPEGIQANDLNVVVPAIGSVTGNGTIGANNSLNFKMLAKLTHTSGVLGGLSGLASFGQSKGQVPFMITGTTSNPIFVPDVGKALANTITSQPQNVGGLLNGLFGHKKPN